MRKEITTFVLITLFFAGLSFVVAINTGNNVLILLTSVALALALYASIKLIKLW